MIRYLSDMHKKTDLDWSTKAFFSAASDFLKQPLTPPSDDNSPAAQVSLLCGFISTCLCSGPFAHMTRNATDQHKVSRLITRVTFCLFPQMPGDNMGGHVMGVRCQGGLGSREQNQRLSAQSGIVVLTINMRTVM